mgnify:CR=1 FL=1
MPVAQRPTRRTARRIADAALTKPRDGSTGKPRCAAGRLPLGRPWQHNSRMLEETSPASKSPRRIAIVGGGLAGLVAADRLLAAGHSVVVFEKYPEAGGLVGLLNRRGLKVVELCEHELRELWVAARHMNVERRPGLTQKYL